MKRSVLMICKHDIMMGRSRPKERVRIEAIIENIDPIETQYIVLMISEIGKIDYILLGSEYLHCQYIKIIDADHLNYMKATFNLIETKLKERCYMEAKRLTADEARKIVEANIIAWSEKDELQLIEVMDMINRVALGQGRSLIYSTELPSIVYKEIINLGYTISSVRGFGNRTPAFSYTISW